MKTHLSLDDLRKTDASEELAALRERVAELQAETGYTDAIRAVARDENRRLREALMRYEDDFCEGWCKENGGTFSDCSGCIARAALAAEPASGEADPRLALYDLETSGLHELAFPPPPPMQGDEETARRILESRLQQGGTWLAQRDIDALAAALRQRADEATRAENEACAKIADSFTCGLCGMDGKSAAVIRARIKP